MKANKIIFIIGVFIFIFIFTSCSPSDKTKGNIETDVQNHENNNKNFNYSTDLTEKGFFKNVKALEYVKLPNYKGIIIPSNIHKISQETLQSEIDSLLSKYAENNQIKNRTIKDGDTLNIDYIGTIDGVAFEGGNTNKKGTSVTIGKTNYIDDFLEQLIGHTPGESFKIEVTFPEDYGVESLNGKDAIFTVTINYIIESVIPELTDKFVVQNLSTEYNCNTVEELRERVKNNLQESSIKSYLYDYLLENSIVSSLPNNVVNYETNLLIDYYKKSANQYNMELNDYLNSYLGQTLEKLIDTNSDKITDSGNYSVILQAIAEKTNISVTKNDLTSYCIKYLGSDNYSNYEKQYGLPYINFLVLRQLVLDYLIDNSILE